MTDKDQAEAVIAGLAKPDLDDAINIDLKFTTDFTRRLHDQVEVLLRRQRDHFMDRIHELSDENRQLRDENQRLREELEAAKVVEGLAKDDPQKASPYEFVRNYRPRWS